MNLARTNGVVVLVTLFAMASPAQGADSITEDFSGAALPASLEDAPGSEFGEAPVYGGSADWSAIPADPGGGNRSFVRTVDSDYNSSSFRAEITVIHEVTNGDEDVGRNGVFGFGTGQRKDDSHIPGSSTPNQFGLPTAGPVIYVEATTLFNSGYLVRGWEADHDPSSFGSITGVSGMVDDTGSQVSMTDGGTHRLRMDYDADLDTLHFSVDVDYTGGPFVADTVMDPFDTNAFGANGQDIPEGALGVSPAQMLTMNGGGLAQEDELGDPVEFKDTNSHIFFGGENLKFDDLSIVVTGGGLACNLDGDLDCDIADLDLLYAAGSPADIATWLTQASSPSNPYKADPADTYVVGDINLDGNVDSADLGALLNNFNSTAGVGWSGGDLNDDNNVDSADLGTLLNNFNFTSAAASVPEPTTASLLMLAFASLFYRRCKRLVKLLAEPVSQ